MTYLEEVQTYLDQMSRIVTDSQREVESERVQHEACRKALQFERHRCTELVQTLSFIKAQFHSLSAKGIDIKPIHPSEDPRRKSALHWRYRGTPNHLQRNWRRRSTDSSSPQLQQTQCNWETSNLVNGCRDEGQVVRLPTISETHNIPVTSTAPPSISSRAFQDWGQQPVQEQKDHVEPVSGEWYHPEIV